MPGKPQNTLEPRPGDDPWEFLRDEAGSIRVEARAESPTQRVLYIATRRNVTPQAELFESMRRDMATGKPVELIFDRRKQARCAQFGRSNRREHRELNALAAKGWVRIVVDASTESPCAERITAFPF